MAMIKPTLPILICLAAVIPAQAKRQTNIVPRGWIQESADPETKTRRFASPDGRAWLITKQVPADPVALKLDMEYFAYRDHEQITYEKRGATWIAVSGYKGDQIFYRKSNLACGGTQWNQIEFGYPREDKRKMDGAVTRMAHGMAEFSNDCGSLPAR
jgi:hypothetical protein